VSFSFFVKFRCSYEEPNPETIPTTQRYHGWSSYKVHPVIVSTVAIVLMQENSWTSIRFITSFYQRISKLLLGHSVYSRFLRVHGDSICRIDEVFIRVIADKACPFGSDQRFDQHPW
jgi:hypothetical protein